MGEKMNYADIKQHLKEMLLSFLWANSLDLYNENSAVVLISTKHLNTADRRRRGLYKQ